MPLARSTIPTLFTQRSIQPPSRSPRSSGSACDPAAAMSCSGALSPDSLFEVLLRVPANDLCRLRTVCRYWRALTTDPQFAAAHKSHHPDPLLAVTFRDGDSRGVAILDLSGQVLRRVCVASDGIRMFPAHLDRVCVTRECKPALGGWVVNPATGALLALPGRRPEELGDSCREVTHDWGLVVMHTCARVMYTLGRVSSSGEYKVVRIRYPHGTEPVCCDVVTLDGSHVGMWRRMPDPEGCLMRSRRSTVTLALNGVIYLLYDDVTLEPGSIGSFDLETEKWMPTLRGPEPFRSAAFRRYESDHNLSLAILNGCLVAVDNVFAAATDLWFLMDSVTSLWVRKYRLNVEQFGDFVHPLLLLDNGRILFKPGFGPLQSYDPATGTSSEMQEIEIADCESVGVYTGSLLI